MPSYVYRNKFKTWQRLEARCRANDFNEGLEARTADPLWFLARQWQMGEFQAEDAGSLVKVEVTYQSEDIDGFSPGTQAFSHLPETAPPLEVLVERESIPWDWRMCVRAGQQFERLLQETAVKESALQKANSFIKHLRQPEQCGIALSDADKLDRDSSFRVSMFAGRSINGQKLTAMLDGLRDPSDQLDQAVLNTAKANFKTWLEEVFCQPEVEGTCSPAWQTNSLDYQFGQKSGNDAHSPEQTELVSPDYRNGDLEWYTSNLKKEAIKSSAPIKSFATTPTRINFAGMPLPRWWAMEDNATDFGQMDVALPDLIKTMLAEFALIFGDDWFVIPLQLKTGTINRIEKIITTDVFGKTCEISSGRVYKENPLERWDLFSLAHADNSSTNAEGDFLYIPPSTGFREESEPVEEVRFFRDEGANMVWAVEQTVANDWGKPVSVFDLYNEKLRVQQTADSDESQKPDGPKQSRLTYQLASTVPSNWIPFIPARIKATSDQIMLQLAKMPHEDGEIEPRTRILNSWEPGEPKAINEETINRAGVKVQLTRQRLRWIDGKTYVWLGRKVVTGRGEGRSGLVFDKVYQKVEEKIEE